MARFGTVNDVMLDNEGNPLAGGKLYFYDSGTLNAKTTYSDQSETTANASPVVLDAFGRVPDIFFSGSARVRVLTSADVLLDDMDPLPGIEYALQQFAEYQATITYGKYDIVRDGDDFYDSLQNANTNNTPSSSPAYWQKLIFDTAVTGLTAGTTQTQAGATAMTASINEFSTVANANDGGQLPEDTAIGESVVVINNGAEDMQVWPDDGSQINSGATDAVDSAVLASGASRVYRKQTATKWTYSAGAEALAGYISGLLTSNNSTDSDHDVDVAVGIATDSTGSEYLELESAITKQIDATWASGDDAGGLASGATLGNNTWYHVFLVKVGGSVDVMFDTSVTCANGVANNSVTAFRRIGAVRTDGSANIHGFSQFGDRFTWSTVFSDVSDTSPGTTEQTYTLTVPTGVKTTALATALVRYDAGFSKYRFYETTQTDETVGNNNSWNETSSNVRGTGVQISLVADTSAQIHYKNTVEVDSVYLGTFGYLDTRGK